MLMIQLMVGVPTVTGTQDPIRVESDMTRGHMIFVIVLNSFHLNPYDDIIQGPREYSS